jgi:hypothetical protein
MDIETADERSKSIIGEFLFLVGGVASLPDS